MSASQQKVAGQGTVVLQLPATGVLLRRQSYAEWETTSVTGVEATNQLQGRGSALKERLEASCTHL